MTNAVYLLKHVPSNKFYVGSSGGIKQRLINHRSALRNNKHYCKPLQAFYNEDPSSIEECIILVSDREMAFELEQFIIDDAAASGLLLNVSPDAKTPYKGLKHSEETRQKITASRIGELNPNYGKRMSDATKQKIAQAITGEANHFYGKTHSEESREKIRDAVLQRIAAGTFKTNQRKVVVDGVEYNSVKEAAQALGISSPTLVGRIKKTSPRWSGYQYKER